MTDPVVTAVKADVASAESKVVAYVKAHVPTAVAAVVGYAGGHFGVLSLLLKHVL